MNVNIMDDACVSCYMTDDDLHQIRMNMLKDICNDVVNHENQAQYDRILSSHPKKRDEFVSDLMPHVCLYHKLNWAQYLYETVNGYYRPNLMDSIIDCGSSPILRHLHKQYGSEFATAIWTPKRFRMAVHYGRVNILRYANECGWPCDWKTADSYIQNIACLRYIHEQVGNMGSFYLCIGPAFRRCDLTFIEYAHEQCGIRLPPKITIVFEPITAARKALIQYLSNHGVEIRNE